jgi:hypothetical protein
MTTPYCWTVNAFGEVWTLYQQGGGNLISPAGEDFAQDIVFGSGSIVWVISTEDQAGGALIKGCEPTYESWFTIPAPAAASRIASDPSGNLWTVNDMGEVWYIEAPLGGGYLASPAGEDFALDIDCGQDGTVWIASTEIDPDYGNLLKRWDAGSQTWITLPGPATGIKVASGPGGVVYSLNSKGEIWLLYPQGGGVMISPPGMAFAQDISIGPDGTVWAVSGNNERPGGDAVMWWAGANEVWYTIPAPAAAVAVSGAM